MLTRYVKRLEDGDITMPLVQTEIPLSKDVASPTPQNAQSTEPSPNAQKSTPEESYEFQDNTSPSMSTTTTRYPNVIGNHLIHMFHYFKKGENVAT